jgi:hypothetical protein
MKIKIYNNRLQPHFLNFSFFYIGKPLSYMYAIKIGNFVIEFRRY